MKESEIRDYLLSNFDNFHKNIKNLDEFEKSIKEEEFAIYKSNIIQISDLIKLVLIDKIIHSTKNIEFYKIIDKEFPLLETPSKRGKQPSVDLLAYNTSSFNLALLELKISDSSEREAITELSAYTIGLQNRFNGLSNLEVIWIPISTAWKTTLKSAVEFSMIWKNTQTLPLKLNIIEKNSKIKSLEFHIINLIKEINEIDYLNLFSYECFDTFDYYTRFKVKDKNGFINYVTSIFNRQNINGFIVFHKDCPNMMYPYGFTLCVFNPFKGYLHKKHLQQILHDNPKQNYIDILKGGHKIIDTNYVDIDFKTNQINYFEPNEFEDGTNPINYHWKKDFLSIGDFIAPEDSSNFSYVIKHLKNAIDSSNENPRAFGTPDFEIWFRELKNKDVLSVSYLGLHHDLISKKINIEHKKNIHSKNFFQCLSTFSYLKKTFKDFNKN